MAGRGYDAATPAVSTACIPNLPPTEPPTRLSRDTLRIVDTNSPVTTNEPDWRESSGPCSHCGADSYYVHVRQQAPSGGLSTTTARNHMDNQQPADGECKRTPGQPHLRTDALARFATTQYHQHSQSPNHAQTWSSLATYVAALMDDDPDIMFFERRGAFEQIDGRIEFIPTRVPPLDDPHDFLSGFGGATALTGGAALKLLIGAVLRRQDRAGAT